jgi:lipase
MTPRGSDKSARLAMGDRPAGTIQRVTRLHVHRFGPPGPVRLLALHGLTGHGQRWETLASGHLPEIAVAAPDLIGHGRSSWAAPWTIDANVAALAELLEQQADDPVAVVAHSFGCAVAMHLAAAHPGRISGLVLLDPAIGLDGGWMREIADAMLASPDYSNAAEARAAKTNGSWAEVDPAVVDAELDEHLVELPGGRWTWRLSLPAMMAYWSELAREIVLPPKRIGTTLVRAAWTSPAYVTEPLIDALHEQLGADLQFLTFDCDHMVAEIKPAEVAALIRERLG